MGQGALPVGGWRIDEAGRLTIEITIPFNASARVVLPNAQLSETSLNDQRLREGDQIGDNVELTLGAGCYTISYHFLEKDTPVEMEAPSPGST